MGCCVSSASIFSNITSPWTDLHEENQIRLMWAWKSSHQQTFHAIKTGCRFCKEIPCFSIHFAVFMAASGTNLETTLQQTNKEKVRYPVSCICRKLSAMKSNCDTTGKQFLATWQALKLQWYLLLNLHCIYDGTVYVLLHSFLKVWTRGYKIYSEIARKKK